MEYSMGDKIRKLRKNLKLTQTQLGEVVGVSKNAIYDWEKGAYLPERENLNNLVRALNTSISDLTGSDSGKAKESVNIQTQSNVAPYNPSHMIRVRVLDKSYGICCGAGIDWGSEAIDYEDILHIPISELAKRYGDDDLIGAYADGNSMEPRIKHGDLVIFVPHEKEILYAGIVMVVTYNNKMMIRGVVMNNQKKITLKALNKAEYADIVITPDDDFDVCGRVVKIHSVSDPGTVL